MKKTGNLNEQKPLLLRSVNWKLYEETQFYSNKGQTEHCAGESRGTIWLYMDPEYVLRTPDAVETGVFLRAVYGEWRMRMEERVIGKWFGSFCFTCVFDSFQS